MTYTYGLHGSPAVGGGLPGLPKRQHSTGITGDYMLGLSGQASGLDIVVPNGVTSICAVVIGAGETIASGLQSGRGGCLRWANEIQVLPGSLLRLAGSSAGGQLTVDGVIVLRASFDPALTTPLGIQPGGYLVGGGNGGAAGTGSASVGGAGGGGAGGYLGNGGDSGGTAAGAAAAVGSGAGGAGGGGRYASLVTTYQNGGNGGGVGPYGVLESPPRTGAGGGIGDASSGYFGRDGGDGEGIPVGASKFGGGMGGRGSGIPGVAQPGCVRVIFGEGRSFPYNAR